MKLKLHISILCLAAALAARAQLNIPGADGSDGVFAPDGSQTNIVIDLSQAVTASWNANNAANAGKGVYDPAKWAVVFKYASVNIPKGVRVSFQNHPSRAPVVWLINGEAIINGEVNLDSQPSPDLNREAGPGGFRGGARVISAGNGNGAGLGPGGGGGPLGELTGVYGPSSVLSKNYGNSRIVPLIGGSGGTGSSVADGNAGGGAILIASNAKITLGGLVSAVNAVGIQISGYAGSGGAIRLVADAVVGNGVLDARSRHSGGDGRIRLEALNYAGGLTVYPPTLRVMPDSPPVIFPDNLPTARVVSVAGQNAPADPRSNLTESGTDVAMQGDQPVDIQIETANLAPTATVTAHIIPRHGDRYIAKAVHISGDASLSRWVATTNVPPGFAVIQVRAVGP